MNSTILFASKDACWSERLWLQTLRSIYTCRKEAARDAAKEPLLSSFMYASILSHDNFLECLAFVLANRMSNPTVLATEYFDAFMTTFNENSEIIQAALDDLQAVRERVIREPCFLSMAQACDLFDICQWVPICSGRSYLTVYRIYVPP